MSAPILKEYVDERGNISVRVSHDVQVLTREEADRIEAEYKRMQSENAKLRELVRAAYNCTNAGPSCLECRIVAGGCTLLSAMRELGVS